MNDSKRKAEGANSSEKDPERFYCPYPGCNRSFAELWRLKVHYRAPPDIRGSGKERGHGTELTHCPKCGKTLKPGKHHVGCSAGRSAPRQASKRSRVNGEDDGRSDLSPADSAEPSMPVPPLALPNGLPFTIDTSSPSLASFNLLPNQYNNPMNFLGFDNAASKHSTFNLGLQHPDPQFQGYLTQMDSVSALHPHTHPAAVHPAHAAHLNPHAQAMQVNNAAAAAAAAAAVGAVPNPLLYHHQQQHQLLLAANPYLSLLHPPPNYHGLSPALLHNNPHIPPHMSLHQHQPSPLLPTSAASSSTAPAPQQPPLLNGFESIFDYNDSLLPERPPSPPPLPADFPGVGGMLFNFKQFARPSSSLLDAQQCEDALSMHAMQQPSVKQEDITKSKHSTESSADGDLMQILFGLSDDTPSSATINIGNHADISSKQTCAHHDSFGLKHSGTSNEACSAKGPADSRIEKDVVDLPHSKASQTPDIGPESPSKEAGNGSFLDEPLLPKVDSATELLRLSDGLNGFVDKPDAGCMSRLLGLDHELFGLLQEECGI